MSDKPEDEGLTEDQYRAQLRRLGLRPTGISTELHTMYITTVDDQVVPVPHVNLQTPQQRKETIERIKRNFGVDWGGYAGPYKN